MPRERIVTLAGREYVVTEHDDGTFSLPSDLASMSGRNTALKPAHEPIVVARKPLAGTVAATVLRHGTGALNIDGCRVGGGGGTRLSEVTAKGGGIYEGGINTGGFGEVVPGLGRWPANVALDDAAAAMLDKQTGELVSGEGSIKSATGADRNGNTSAAYGAESRPAGSVMVSYGDRGGASRFFYCAKASTAERSAGVDRNVHPTVKPIDLMRWLVRLVTPPDGLVLDPFTGSGTTGCAAVLEGFRFVGLEREAEYAAIARARVEWWAQQPRDVPLERLLGGDRARAAASERGQGSIFDVIESEAA